MALFIIFKGFYKRKYVINPFLRKKIFLQAVLHDIYPKKNIGQFSWLLTNFSHKKLNTLCNFSSDFLETVFLLIKALII